MAGRRWWRRGTAWCSLAVLVLVSGALAGIAPASGQGPTGGWASERLRLEPVGAGGTIRVADVGTFRGAVELVPDGAGLAVVNDVGLEDYVRGIAEVPSSWPIEAQKAQAVAARSYALNQVRGRRSTRYRAVGADICATQACQVYRGVGPDRPGWDAAVAATAGEVLLDGNGPIRAMYASSNGGRSDPGGAPYLPGVDDPDDERVSPWARWRATFTLDQVATALPGPGRLVGADRAGDTFVLRYEQDDGAIVDRGVAPAEIRATFNARLPRTPGLPVAVLSTRFTAFTEGDTVVLDGAGFGHLVGMSQFGALGKAQRGLGHADILATYYGGIRPTVVGPGGLPASLRVAMAHERPSVRLSGQGFRVLDAGGAVLAHLGVGDWEVRPDGAGRVVAVPPEGQAGAPGVALSAPSAELVRVELAAPAAVRILDPGGTVLVDLGVRRAGGVDIPLTGPVPSGARLDLVAEADAGGGRVARAELTIAPPVAGEEPDGGTSAAELAGAGKAGPRTGAVVATVAPTVPAERPVAPTAVALVALLAAAAALVRVAGGPAATLRATFGRSPRPS